MDRITEEPRGIAFVDFGRPEDVDVAYGLNGTEIEDGLDVSMHYEVPKVRPRPEGCLSVVVKTLAPEATDDEVRGLFKGLEGIQEVRLIRDRETKLCRGMAFVDFAEGKAVEAAVRRSGMKVGGRTIFVGYETKAQKVSGMKEPGTSDAPGASEVKKAKKVKKPQEENKEATPKVPQDKTAEKPAGDADAEAKIEKRKKKWEERQARKAGEAPQNDAEAAVAKPAAEKVAAEGADEPMSKMARKKAKRKAEAAAAAAEGAEAEEEVPAKKAKKA